MSTAALFNRILYAELNAYAAWLPVTNTFKLGDYGLISNGVFTPIGNITEFGVAFAEEHGPPATLDLTSAGTRVIRFVGDVEVPALPDAPLDAKLVFHFPNESSVLAKAAAITTKQMGNVRQVASTLVRAKGWERRYRVVWGTYTGQRCAVVTTRSSNASFELSGKANVLSKLELGAVEAGVTLAHERNIGFKSLGKTGVIALRLFKLKLWGDSPKLLGPGDEPEVEQDGPADLEDDV